jgi:high-affinity iron transporter
MSLKKHLVSVLVLLAVPAAFGAETASSPRLVVHLLDYLAKDYSGAVENGKVVSKGEYQEQVEFAESALKMSRELAETKGSADVVAGIESLNGLIAKKAPAGEVSALALALKQKVIALTGIVQAPTRWPSLAHGRELYQRACVSCHGVTGAGDGPAGKGLEPVPANFREMALGYGMIPFRAFNTIRVGIPGTGMTPFPMYADEDVWDLAFYVSSLHWEGKTTKASVSPADLALAATKSDEQLMDSLPGTDEEKKDKIAALRLHDGGSAGGGGGGGIAESANSLGTARNYLGAAETAYAKGDFGSAKQSALLAYLEGIEPVEPRLRANDPEFVAEIESKMAAVRSSIEARQPLESVRAAVGAAHVAIAEADQRLTSKPSSPWVAFVLTVGILLREGFEAVLILIAFLAVIRASGSKKAARWVHFGWIAAIALGFVAWFSSGWLMAISGAQREMLEGVTSLVAVAALLYVGFWLHSKTEIGRWTAFIHGSVKTALEGGSLWGLAGISFMAVFREAFETVLFLRAITLEGGSGSTGAMALGVILSLVALLAISWAILRYSAKLPIRKIFSVSSLLMAVLAVILTGKGLHALQETGALPVTSIGRLRWDLFGIYPTLETAVPQVAIALFIWGLWHLGRRTSAAPATKGAGGPDSRAGTTG